MFIYPISRQTVDWKMFNSAYSDVTGEYVTKRLDDLNINIDSFKALPTVASKRHSLMTFVASIHREDRREFDTDADIIITQESNYNRNSEAIFLLTGDFINWKIFTDQISIPNYRDSLISVFKQLGLWSIM